MTYAEWESGERLTAENATKEQLKAMYKDLCTSTKRYQEEIQKHEKALFDFSALFAFFLSEIGEQKTAEILKKWKEQKK